MEKEPVSQTAGDIVADQHENQNQSSNSIDPSQCSDSVIGIEPKHEQEVFELARSKTGMSMTAGHASTATEDGANLSNPFLGATDPTLDPFSDKFSLKAWLQTLMSIATRQHGGFPRRNVGVSFRNLSAYGYGSTTDYQKDFANVLLEGPGIINKSMSKGQKRIDILRQFDGLVRRGEMLVVLGRPGR